MKPLSSEKLKSNSKYSALRDVDIARITVPMDQYHDLSPTDTGENLPLSPPPKYSFRRLSSIDVGRSLGRRLRGVTWIVWIRWGVIILLQSIIVSILVWGHGEKIWTPKDTETGADINGIYIPHSHKYTLLQHEPSKYMPNMSSNDDRLEVRHNWDLLLPMGSGTVRIPNWEQYPMLGTPITDDPIRSGPIFETAWTHALHCLYYTLDTYHQLVVSHGTKFGLHGARNDWHVGHCFEYLRLQIMCMADMTLEGAHSVLDPEGEGTAHVCRDKGEVFEWLEGKRVDDLRSIVVGLKEHGEGHGH